MNNEHGNNRNLKMTTKTRLQGRPPPRWTSAHSQ